MTLTVAYITARKEPLIEWFLDSLHSQVNGNYEGLNLLIVDNFTHLHDSLSNGEIGFRQRSRLQNLPTSGWISAMPDTVKRFNWVYPKPTIWQGQHRITKTDWWAKSNAHNTAIILCETDWIAFVDDRCVLTPIWLKCVQEAMYGNYAVCGSYEKRSGMVVENGEIMDMGQCLGVDVRTQFGYPEPTSDWYGGSCALPLEWCLQVNGYSEDLCDSVGSEDSMFGRTLLHSGLPMKFDSRMRIIEDRTPGPAYEGALKRADKGVDGLSPHESGRRAKSWAIVKAFYKAKTSGNSYDIRQHRARVQNGEDLQSIMPSASHFDWYDGQPISEME